LTDPSPGGRFERHPRLTGAGLLAGALVALELALRLFAPVPLRFAHAMRGVHGYSRIARVDLRPSQSARLRIERRGGEPLFDFRITTGSDAFRIVEGEEEAAPLAARYVHAIGDSYTMGWGVDAPLSYPAQLARRLGPGLAVLNLGVDGFGAIGATAKSRALADRYPPAVAVYLFCPNDLDDDVQAAAVARRGKAAHAAYEAFDALRRASYLAGVPFALRYRLQFRAGPAAIGANGTNAGTIQTGEVEWEDPTRLLLPEPAALPAPQPDARTFASLREYRDFLQTRGARLVVLVLSNQHESLMAYRFCKEQGIEAHLFDVPPGMRIPDEGHFNALGNATVAALVEQLLRKAPNGAGS
jgi:lysophospholipase L1-like esterase